MQTERRPLLGGRRGRLRHTVLWRPAGPLHPPSARAPAPELLPAQEIAVAVSWAAGVAQLPARAPVCSLILAGPPLPSPSPWQPGRNSGQAAGLAGVSLALRPPPAGGGPVRAPPCSGPAPRGRGVAGGGLMRGGVLGGGGPPAGQPCSRRRAGALARGHRPPPQGGLDRGPGARTFGRQGKNLCL